MGDKEYILFSTRLPRPLIKELKKKALDLDLPVYALVEKAIEHYIGNTTNSRQAASRKQAAG